MGRGVSCGGGRSSLGYLFGSESDGAAALTNTSSSSSPTSNPSSPSPKKEENPKSPMGHRKESSSSPIKWETQQAPSAQPGHLKNNYYRSEGQNCGNFITDRPTTKVHAAPGGGSSLGYLFGDPNKK